MTLAHKLLLGAALAMSLGTAASAADLLQPSSPVYSSSLFNFEGFYVGGSGGLTFSNTVYGNAGVIVGNNFQVTDGIIAGLEFQGDAFWTGGGMTAYDLLGLGRIGAFASDNVLVTGDLGLGFVNGAPVYALGGGAEMAVTSNFSVRGDVQAISYFGHAPSALKTSVGLIWHFN